MCEPRRRRRGPSLLARNIPVLLAILLAATPVGGAAQTVPVRPGQTIRVATEDSAALDLWRAGRVLAATRIGVLMATQGSPVESIPVALNASRRLQVQRRSLRPMFIGGGVGLAAGGALGGTLLSSVFGASWGDEGPVAEIILFGLLGLGAGGVTSHLVTSPRWVDVPVTVRGLPPVALTRVPSRTGSFTRTERWEWFEPTELEFAAFFAQWRDSLDALEGIWELQRPGSVGRSRMAVVRDARFRGYEYIGIRLSARGFTVRSPEDGIITLVIRRADTPGQFEVRYVGLEAPPGRFFARLEEGLFRIQVGAWTDDWMLQSYVSR